MKEWKKDILSKDASPASPAYLLKILFLHRCFFTKFARVKSIPWFLHKWNIEGKCVKVCFTLVVDTENIRNKYIKY